jgi:hypothetical protein
VSGLGVWAECAFGVDPRAGGAVGALPNAGAAVGFEGCPNPPVVAAGWINGEVLEAFTLKAAGCEG